MDSNDPIPGGEDACESFSTRALLVHDALRYAGPCFGWSILTAGVGMSLLSLTYHEEESWGVIFLFSVSIAVLYTGAMTLNRTLHVREAIFAKQKSIARMIGSDVLEKWQEKAAFDKVSGIDFRSESEHK